MSDSVCTCETQAESASSQFALRALQRLEKRQPLLISGCLLCIIVGFLRLPFGFGYGDEGFHLATTARYVSGDRLFIDEHYTTPMAFDAFTWLLMAVSPFNTVLFWRVVGYFAQVGTLLLVWITLGRLKLLPQLMRTILFCGLVLYIPFNLPVLYYNNLSQLFLLCAESLLVAAASSRAHKLAYICAVLSALAFAFAVLSYFPLIALCVPLIAALWLWWRDNRMRTLLLTWYATLAVAALSVFLLLVTTARLSNVFSNLNEKRMFPQYAMPLAERIVLKVFGHHMWTEIGLCTLLFGPLFMIIATHPKLGRIAMIAVTSMMGSLIALFVLGRSGTHSPYLTLFNFTGLLLGLAWSAVVWVRGFTLCELRPMFCAIAVNLTAAAIVVVSASTVSADINQVNVCMWLIWPSLMVLLWKLAEQVSQRGGAYAREMVLAVSVLLMGMSAAHLWRWSYEDMPPHQLRSIFRYGKLRGIISTHQKVEATEKLLRSVDQRVKAGDYMLAYNSFAGLSYLLDLRPALFTTLVGDGQPPEPLFSSWLREGNGRGRKPKVIVVAGSVQKASSLREVLDCDYYAVDHIGEYSLYIERTPDSR